MATVFIPAPLRDLTAGQTQIRLDGKNLRQIIAALDAEFPGISSRLLDSAQNLAPGLSASIDGQLTNRGLYAAVGPDSEVHFVPALGGG